MTNQTPDIDSFSEPLASMLQQSQIFFNNWIKYRGTPDGERALKILEHFEKEIAKHFENQDALELDIGRLLPRKSHDNIFRFKDSSQNRHFGRSYNQSNSR